MTKLISLLILTLTLVSGNLYASGDTSSSEGDDDAISNYFQSKYDFEKQVMESRILCADCPLAGTELDIQGVEDISMQLKEEGGLATTLSKKQRKAANYYLKKRFL
ncbi:MAG: hypothetical protein ACI9J2_000416 [Saprospiraceae bacterium]|jgi:hypothetical protein